MKMYFINFAKWNHSYGRIFALTRIYYKGYKWTPFIKVEFRYLFKKQEKIVDKPKEQFIVRNRCKCKVCGTIIESRFRHEFSYCKCLGLSIFTDGGLDYIHRSASGNEISLDEWCEVIPWSDMTDANDLIYYKQMEGTLFKQYLKRRQLTEEEIKDKKDRELEKKAKLLLASYEEERKNKLNDIKN
jgi:hypothetical protein